MRSSKPAGQRRRLNPYFGCCCCLCCSVPLLHFKLSAQPHMRGTCRCSAPTPDTPSSSQRRPTCCCVPEIWLTAMVICFSKVLRCCFNSGLLVISAAAASASASFRCSSCSYSTAAVVDFRWGSALTGLTPAEGAAAAAGAAADCCCCCCCCCSFLAASSRALAYRRSRYGQETLRQQKMNNVM